MKYNVYQLIMASQVAYLKRLMKSFESLKTKGLKPPLAIKDLLKESFDTETAYKLAIADGIPKEEITLKKLIQYSDLDESDKRIIARFKDEIFNWKIIHIRDLNDLNGFYGCCIETSKDQAIVAFRGSENMKIFKNLIKDWGRADLGLLCSDKTIQHEEVEQYCDFMIKSGILDKYKSLAVTGHSLGGNLATYFTTFAAKIGKEKIFNKITQSANLDGPGFSRVFFKKNKEEIDKVTTKGIHTDYMWSGVGALLERFLGAKSRVLAIDETKYKDNPIERAKYLAIKRHSTESVILDEKGDAKDGVQDPVSKALSAFSKTIDKILPTQLVLEIDAVADWLFERILRMKEQRAIEFNDPVWAERFKKKGSIIGTSVHIINKTVEFFKEGVAILNNNSQSIPATNSLTTSPLKPAYDDVMYACNSSRTFRTPSACLAGNFINSQSTIGHTRKGIGREFY